MAQIDNPIDFIDVSQDTVEMLSSYFEKKDKVNPSIGRLDTPKADILRTRCRIDFYTSVLSRKCDTPNKRELYFTARKYMANLYKFLDRKNFDLYGDFFQNKLGYKADIESIKSSIVEIENIRNKHSDGYQDLEGDMCFLDIDSILDKIISNKKLLRRNIETNMHKITYIARWALEMEQDDPDSVELIEKEFVTFKLHEVSSEAINYKV